MAKKNKKKTNAERKMEKKKKAEKKKMIGKLLLQIHYLLRAKRSTQKQSLKRMAAVKREALRFQRSRMKNPVRESSSSSVFLFASKLEANDIHPHVDRLVVAMCHPLLKDALSLQIQRRDISHLEVLATDPWGKKYNLRFSKNNDEDEPGTFILHHGWDGVLGENRFEEGDFVLGFGHQMSNRRFMMNFFFPTMPLRRERNMNPETKKKGFRFLFSRKLEKSDEHQLSLYRCNEKLRSSIQEVKDRHYIVVAYPSEKFFELRFCVQENCILTSGEWNKLVAANSLAEGDTITAFGDLCTSDVTMELYAIKKGSVEQAIINGQLFLFFRTKLQSVDSDPRLGILLIGKCTKEVDEIVALSKKYQRSNKEYVRVSGIDEEGRKYELRLSRFKGTEMYVVYHEWGIVVAANELVSGDTVTFWGSLAEDGTIWMQIDVDKVSENVEPVSSTFNLTFENM